MKKKNISKLLSLVLAVTFVFSLAASPFAYSGKITFTSASGDYTATKISHPEKELGTVDGIVDYLGNGAVSVKDQGQGDRGQNYAWSAIGYGDYVYVGTCFNAMGQTLNFMDSVLGNDFNPEEMQAQLNVMFNGDFYNGEPDGANTGGILVKVNVHTSEVTLLMGKCLDGKSALFRNVCEYKGKLYFCGAVNSIPQIVQVDPETDECKVVYQGIAAKDMMEAHKQAICVTIRGLTEFNGKLIVSCVSMAGPQILISDHPWDGQEAFTEIANQEDLFNYPGYHYTDSIYGGSIWEMANFNNTLYVSLCTGTQENKPDENSMQSFALVKGVENADGTWTWTPVIGDKADGAKYTFGIDPERTRAGAGVLQVYGDHLYIGEYNDEQIALEGILFNADFDFMNANLEQSVSLYRMDKNENIELVVGDATTMFPNGGISGLGSGFGRHENQYIWRMTDYNGKLYVGTFDTSSLLEPIGQFSNGDLATMSVEDWKSILNYVKEYFTIKNSGDEVSTASVSAEMTNKEELTSIFDSYSTNELAEMCYNVNNSEISTQALDVDISALLETVKGFIKCANYMGTATRGFDLYVSEDGVNFETITINGFGDPYNHGLRVFANMEDGLMVGTANPFYAAQLWMLNENAEPVNNLDFSFDGIIEMLIGYIKEVVKFFVSSTWSIFG